ncbi:MAG: HEAT repeat domain-containing protein [Nitrospira sp.]|nr:HEAT repeat domain-containing protein [Nitrospira sp.]
MADTVSEQIAALSDEDWAIREEAATLLGGLNDARAVLPLTKLLRDTDRAVREAAIGALSALGSASVPALAGCLADSALQVQEAASAILASIADARVFRPLVEALGSRDWIVRMHAAKGLGRIGDPEAVNVLMPLLQDKVKAVREEASSALAAIGAAAVLGLIQALEHDDWLVRLHAVEALGKLKSPDSVDPLLRALFNERDSAIREDVVRALGAIRDARAVDYLVTVMKEPGLRLLAVEALGQIGDPRAVPLLRRVVEGAPLGEPRDTATPCADGWTDEMATMGMAARALGMIADGVAIPSLIVALRNTITRSEAAAALAKFGPAVIPSLLPMLAKEQDENIRYHVRETLTAVGWRPGRV